MRARFTIVGGGFSGTAAAVQLLRRGADSVVLVEAQQRTAAGVAYSTDEPFHLLNVPAKNMSALADEPAHFAEWLERRHGLGPEDFAPRRVYRAYLNELLDAEADERLTIINGEAASLRTGEGVSLRLADGRDIRSEVVLLAGGNLPQLRPPLKREAESEGLLYIDDPWSPAGVARLEDIARGGEDVLILGTGLTMVDVCLTLSGHGFQRRMIATSRRGLLPRVHAPFEPAPIEEPEPRLSALVRQTRERAERHGWRAAADALRTHSAWLWQGFTTQERQRFLRHVRPYWDVRRHRIAPAVGATLKGLLEEGRVELVPGRVRSLAGGEVTIAPRGGGAEVARRIGAIVNCTGPGRDIASAADPLLQQLLASGIARPDALGIGLDVDERSRLVRADGGSHPDIYALGPLSRGRFWEIVAVPDIREQAAAVAAELSSSAPAR